MMAVRRLLAESAVVLAASVAELVETGGKDVITIVENRASGLGVEPEFDAVSIAAPELETETESDEFSMNLVDPGLELYTPEREP